MRPERIVAAILFALAGGLIALAVLGPTEGAEASREGEAQPPPAAATTEPATTEAAAPTTTAPPTEPAGTTTEAEETPTSIEEEPAEPPPPLAGDGTFAEPVEMRLSSQEYRWETVELNRPAKRARVDARIIALQGAPGDVHGLRCGSAAVTYDATVDPWTREYLILAWVGNTGEEVGSGAAPGLEAPPRPNRLGLTCVALGETVRLELTANGKRIASIEDDAAIRGLTAVGLTATDDGGGQEVVFDGVVVETG